MCWGLFGYFNDLLGDTKVLELAEEPLDAVSPTTDCDDPETSEQSGGSLIRDRGTSSNSHTPS